jgi:hypothetical protein
MSDNAGPMTQPSRQSLLDDFAGEVEICFERCQCLSLLDRVAAAAQASPWLRHLAAAAGSSSSRAEALLSSNLQLRLLLETVFTL